MLIRILALLSVVGSLLGCEGTSSTDLTISVAGRQLALPANEWQPTENEADYAKNFEARNNQSPRQYQVLTVFLNQMSDDRRSGREIAPGEYLEVFVSNPNEVTVVLRRDHGPYWLLSREMFRGIQVAGVDLTVMKPLSGMEEDRIMDVLRKEIDVTRHVLSERLSAR